MTNDYDEIAANIDEALAAFTGNAHEPRKNNSDSITMTKDGFITGVIRFQRLRDWVEGLAETHRHPSAETEELLRKLGGYSDEARARFEQHERKVIGELGGE